MDSLAPPESSTNVLVDARWIGRGGAGRVTENLLRGLRADPPPGRWTLWGEPVCRDHAWNDVAVIPSTARPDSPRSVLEARHVRGTADVAIFMHQLRPLTRVAPVELTLIHDTILLRYPTRGVPSAGFRWMYRRVARLSDIVMTVSHYSRECIVRDLGVDASRVAVLAQPVDRESAARVATIRGSLEPSSDALYIGRDAPHKNLDRLVRSFALTDLHRRGGSLVLVGVGATVPDRLAATAVASGTRLRCPGVLSQPDLETELARCAVAVQPALEEGFGLPAAEALAAGVPVAATAGGVLGDLAATRFEEFDPLDIVSMAAAIDRAALTTSVQCVVWPSPADLASTLLAALRAAQLPGRHQP